MFAACFYSVPLIAGLGYLGWRLRKQGARIRRQAAEILAAHNIIDGFVHEHWLLLTEANQVLAGDLDSPRNLSALVELLVPSLVDFCAIYTLSSAVSGEGTVVSSAPNRENEWAAVLEETRATGRAKNLEAPGAGIVLPLSRRSGVFGAMAFAHFGKRRFGKFEASLAQQIAARVALHFENSALFREAQEAARAREEMVAIVAHDIRNPLTAIHLQAATLLKLANASPAHDAKEISGLQRIQTASTRIQKMIEDLLDITAIEAGKFAIKRNSTKVRPLLAELFEMMVPVAAEKSIELRCEIDDAQDEACLDRDRIFQVLMNLTANAIKFTEPGGSVVIRVANDSREIIFSVEDTGCGIAEKHLPRIFERYWQGAGHSEKKGLGLGLAICKGIVESHGGRVWAESKLGQGSKFSFTVDAQSEAR